MTIKDTPLAQKANYTYQLNFGELYIYNDFIISEVSEGIVIGKDHLIQIINLVDKHYGFKKPYGLISNRTNAYATNLSEILPLAEEFGCLISNAVVVYNQLSLKNFDLEKQVLKRFKGESFSNIDDAIIWTKSIVNNYKPSY